MIEQIKNNLKLAEDNIKKAKDLLNKLNEPVDPIVDPITDIKVFFDSRGNIVSEWKSDISKPINIKYYSPDADHEKFEHSTKEYLDREILTSEGRFTIGVGDYDTWIIKYEVEDWDSDPFTIIKEKKDNPEPKDPKTYKIHTTLWDEMDHPFDTVRSRNYNELREAIKTDKLITHSLSHIWYKNDTLKPESQWRAILRRFAEEIEGIDSSRIELFLQDEPMGKNVWGNSDKEKIQNLNRLIQMAREVLPDIRIGMSFTRGAYQRKPIPKGLDFYVCPMYLFFRRDLEEYGKGYFAIETQQDFIEQFAEEIKQIRKVIGNNDLYLIGQGFENLGDKNDRVFMRRWRKPPLWYPEVFYNEAQKHNVKAIWWWLVRSNEKRKTKGLQDMPDLFDKIKSIS